MLESLIYFTVERKSQYCVYLWESFLFYPLNYLLIVPQTFLEWTHWGKLVNSARLHQQYVKQCCTKISQLVSHILCLVFANENYCSVSCFWKIIALKSFLKLFSITVDKHPEKFGTWIQKEPICRFEKNQDQLYLINLDKIQSGWIFLISTNKLVSFALEH